MKKIQATNTLPSVRWKRILISSTLATAVVTLGTVALRDLLSPQAVHARDQNNNSKYSLSELRIFNRVVLLIKEQYVEPERIKPREMLSAILKVVEVEIPEVLIEEEGDLINVAVGADKKQFDIKGLHELYELSFKLRDIFRFIEARASPSVDLQNVEYAAINGMLSELDPHSNLLEPKFSQEMKLSTRGEFGGLGIVISVRDGALTVISPIDETPASRAGILAQDQIVKIADESTVNMAIDEAVERLRGKPGTPVTISVLRKGWDEPKVFTIVRDIIKVESVTHQLLDDGTGYVKVKQFQGKTAEDVRGAIEKMKKQKGGDLKGLILDLRNNPGGLLDQAIELSDLFLRDGTIVITQEGGRSGERQEVPATSRDTNYDMPIVVLVNGGSASASEIVSGALRNRNRALVVGEQTFGKGSVQQLYDFPDSSALKLTVGQYLTPGNESIQSVGIAPDVALQEVTIDGKENINIFPDERTKEGDLSQHLKNDKVVVRTSSFDLPFLGEKLDDAELERRANTNKFVSDFSIQFAQKVLSKSQISRRDDMLRVAGSIVSEIRGTEETKISEALRALNIDWSSSGTPTNVGAAQPVAISVVKAEPTKAGDTLTVTLQVQNKGTAPLWRVRGISQATVPLFADREFLFGKLMPGQSQQWTVTTKIPKGVDNRLDVMRVDMTDAAGSKLGTIDVPIQLIGQQHPRFSYAMFVDDTANGNGDGLLQVGESVELVLSIRNSGTVASEEPTVLLKNLGGAEIFIDKGRQKLEALKADASMVARLAFKVQSTADVAQLRLQIFDGVSGDSLVEKIRLPIRAAGGSIQKGSGVVEVKPNTASILAAADTGAGVIARANAGAKLTSLGSVGPYTRVQVGNSLFGFVPTADVAPSSGAPSVQPSGQPKGLSLVYGRDPPRITFPQVATTGIITTDGDTFNLQVNIDDDGAILDTYIFSNENKVYFESLKTTGATKKALQVPLKLEPGINVVTAIAREDDDFAQNESVIIFSKKGDPLAKKKHGSHDGE